MKTEDKQEAILACPHCSFKDNIAVPHDRCLPFYECSNCEEVISVSNNSDDCCVVCAYSDGTCPVG